MTLLEPVLLGLLIGLVLGSLGGGGAILTVPALVYVVGRPAHEATAGSLIIVGLAALVGVAGYVSSHRVSWTTGLGFGVAGIPATIAGSALNHHVYQDVLLIGFSVLMVLAAVAMARPPQRRGRDAPSDVSGFAHDGVAAPAPGGGVAVLTATDRVPRRTTHDSVLTTVAVGLGVGFLTGFFGVGGGFVIVPALVLLLGLPMELAVGTSLLIVVINSATSLLARVGSVHLDLSVVVPFTLAAMVATLLGKRVADRLPAARLKVAFAALLVLVAGYTAVESIHGLLTATGAAPS